MRRLLIFSWPVLGVVESHSAASDYGTPGKKTKIYFTLSNLFAKNALCAYRGKKQVKKKPKQSTLHVFEQHLSTP